MILDSHAQFSVAQAITADAASTNVYDTGSAADSGTGKPIRLYCSIPVAFNTLTSLNIIAETDDAVGFPSAKALWTVNKLLADLTLNAKIDLPPIPSGCERFLRLRYDVVGTDPTLGQISAGVILSDQKNIPTSDFA